MICEELGIGLKKTVIEDDNFSKESLTYALDNLRPRAIDIVAFFYSGHGFRWKDQASRYPSLFFSYSRYQKPDKTNSVTLEEVYDKMVG